MTNILSLSWYRDKLKINSIFNGGLTVGQSPSDSLNAPTSNRSLNLVEKSARSYFVISVAF